jgi:hypothetical protein
VFDPSNRGLAALQFDGPEGLLSRQGRLRNTCGMVFRDAIGKGPAEHDPSDLLKVDFIDAANSI